MLYRFVENVFNYVKFCAARFARRTVIYLVLYIVYADGGNIHGPPASHCLQSWQKNVNTFSINMMVVAKFHA